MSFLNRKMLVAFLVLSWSPAPILLAGQGDETAPISYETAYNHRGEVYFQDGFCDQMSHGSDTSANQNLANAEQSFKKAIEINEFNVEAHRNLARLYYFEKKFDLAGAEYATSIRLDPNDIGAYVDMALLQTELGNIEEAVRYLEQAKNCTKDERMLRQINRYMIPPDRGGHPDFDRAAHHRSP